MSYTKPVPYADGAAITAAGLASNYTEARRYINWEIAAGDLSAGLLQRRHLTPGRSKPLGGDHTHIGGDVYSEFVGESTGDHVVFTHQVKSKDETGKSYSATDTWLPIPGVCRSVNITHPGQIILIRWCVAARLRDGGAVVNTITDPTIVAPFITANNTFHTINAERDQKLWSEISGNRTGAGGAFESRIRTLQGWHYAEVTGPGQDFESTHPESIAVQYHCGLAINPIHEVINFTVRNLTAEVIDL